MDIQLKPSEYAPPSEVPFAEPAARAEYLAGHRAGWLAFAQGSRTTLTEDGRMPSELVGLGAVRPSTGTEAELAGFDAGFRAATALHFQRIQEATSKPSPPAGEWESPVGEADRLDLITTRDDGTVAVTVVVARPLDPADQRTASRLEAKLRNYCRYIKHPAFAREFGAPSPERVKLVLRSDWEVPEAYIRLLAQVADEEDVPAGLEVHYE